MTVYSIYICFEKKKQIARIEQRIMTEDIHLPIIKVLWTSNLEYFKKFQKTFFGFILTLLSAITTEFIVCWSSWSIVIVLLSLWLNHLLKHFYVVLCNVLIFRIVKWFFFFWRKWELNLSRIRRKRTVAKTEGIISTGRVMSWGVPL